MYDFHLQNLRFCIFFVYLRERLKDYERLWSGTVMSREKVIGTHNF